MKVHVPGSQRTLGNNGYQRGLRNFYVIVEFSHARPREIETGNCQMEPAVQWGEIFWVFSSASRNRVTVK
jgi:hypothetical protein